MIAIKRICRLAELARKAALVGDLTTIAILNSDEELQSANLQFMVVEGVCYIAYLDQLDRTTPEKVREESPKK